MPILTNELNVDWLSCAEEYPNWRKVASMLLLDLQSYGTGLGDRLGEQKSVGETALGHSKNVNQQGIFIYEVLPMQQIKLFYMVRIWKRIWHIKLQRHTDMAWTEPMTTTQWEISDSQARHTHRRLLEEVDVEDTSLMVDDDRTSGGGRTALWAACELEEKIVLRTINWCSFVLVALFLLFQCEIDFQNHLQ